MEYQTSRQEWMARNQLVYSMQAARWKSVLGKPTRLVTPWGKGLYRALCCGDVRGEELEQALRACFRKYLGFDGSRRCGRASGSTWALTERCGPRRSCGCTSTTGGGSPL